MDSDPQQLRQAIERYEFLIRMNTDSRLLSHLTEALNEARARLAGLARDDASAAPDGADRT